MAGNDPGLFRAPFTFLAIGAIGTPGEALGSRGGALWLMLPYLLGLGCFAAAPFTGRRALLVLAGGLGGIGFCGGAIFLGGYS